MGLSAASLDALQADWGENRLVTEPSPLPLLHVSVEPSTSGCYGSLSSVTTDAAPTVRATPAAKDRNPAVNADRDGPPNRLAHAPSGAQHWPQGPTPALGSAAIFLGVPVEK